MRARVCVDACVRALFEEGRHENEMYCFLSLTLMLSMRNVTAEKKKNMPLGAFYVPTRKFCLSSLKPKKRPDICVIKLLFCLELYTADFI